MNKSHFPYEAMTLLPQHCSPWYASTTMPYYHFSYISLPFFSLIPIFTSQFFPLFHFHFPTSPLPSTVGDLTSQHCFTSEQPVGTRLTSPFQVLHFSLTLLASTNHCPCLPYITAHPLYQAFFLDCLSLEDGTDR